MSIDYINKLTENLKIDKPIKLNIVLDGGSFNGGYLYGSLLYLKHLEKNNKIIINKISGCSVGALMSVLYIIDKLEVTENIYEIILEKLKKKSNFKHIQKIIKYIANNYFEENFYEKCNNKLYITYFNIDKHKQIVKKKYKSNDDLLEALIKSSYIPFFNGKNILYKNKFIDGIYPYIPNESVKVKTLYLSLSYYYKYQFNTKNQSNIYSRMMAGILDIHKFFINNKKTKICSYINQWSIKEKILEYLKVYLVYLIIYLIQLINFFYSITPSFVFYFIKNNIFIKIIFKIFKELYIDFFLE